MKLGVWNCYRHLYRYFEVISKINHWLALSGIRNLDLSNDGQISSKFSSNGFHNPWIDVIEHAEFWVVTVNLWKVGDFIKAQACVCVCVILCFILFYFVFQTTCRWRGATRCSRSRPTAPRASPSVATLTRRDSRRECAWYQWVTWVWVTVGKAVDVLDSEHDDASIFHLTRDQIVAIDYGYESRKGPLCCFASTNFWFVTRSHQK
jgi:hypothetical protein